MPNDFYFFPKCKQNLLTKMAIGKIIRYNMKSFDNW